MNSVKLNEKIAKLCDNISIYESFGCKSIPYIGWFWRNVDFTSKTHYFGILPCGIVGFMEKNKWGYNYVLADEAEWKIIKTLLQRIAAFEPTSEPGGLDEILGTYTLLDATIQSLGAKDEITEDQFWDEWERKHVEI